MPYALALVICLASLSAEPGEAAECPEGWRDCPPRALLELERARARLATSRLEIRETRLIQADAGAEMLVTNSTLSHAGNDRLRVITGDDTGVLVRTPDGQPSPTSAHAGHRQLLDGPTLWSKADAGSMGKQYTHDRPNNFLLDPRALGIVAGMSFGDVDECLYTDATANPKPRCYREYKEGTLVVVEADTSSGLRRWWIDPDKDWNVVRATNSIGGQRSAEARIELDKMDGHWFPRRVQYFLPSTFGDTPHEVVEVKSASFNRPDHPQDFSPADAGIVDGTTVEQWNAQGPTGVFGVAEAGKLRVLSRTPMAEAAAGAADHIARSISGARDAPSEWERYVRQFIIRHGLDDGQRQAAWRVLRSCQDEAGAHLRRASRAFEAFESRAARLKSGGELGREDREKLDAELAELRAPLDRIFETRLKPRLDGLLTAQQKAARH